ncbi:hypothetical protein [Flammeovirga aprica]|uniref:Outer membrane protein beta-barrel domain-containing protein n=1 Tax=Flammeovirga aprica JL-4 TaxID=694437 RepID=A0A7X9XDK9_9BACT|nr:hypothetical protein [Flammeovirga aprica]NME72910.1 hypothetical protein [Flammeovirga aprica JL-4]
MYRYFRTSQNFRIKDTRFFGLVGPFVNFHLYDFGKLYIDGLKVDNDQLPPVDYRYKIDYGFNLGLGVHLDRYLVMLHYDYGFDRTIKNQEPFTGTEYESTIENNNAIKLTVAYKLKS